jgi:hypothetical protein
MLSGAIVLILSINIIPWAPQSVMALRPGGDSGLILNLLLLLISDAGVEPDSLEPLPSPDMGD